MTAAKRVVFTMLCFCVCAHAQSQTLAVYSRGAPGLDSLMQVLRSLRAPYPTVESSPTSQWTVPA